MIAQELPMREYYAHLRRHPIPEIMDDACLAAVANVEAQYGNTITHGAGLEVRLGEQARYVDYIMNIDVEHIPFVSSLWYEIDYAEFAKGVSPACSPTWPLRNTAIPNYGTKCCHRLWGNGGPAGYGLPWTG